MAFYVITPGPTGGSSNYKWYVNERKPLIPTVSSADDIPLFHLIADGDELEQIKVRFVNVPHCHHITTWRGEMARFIFENLPDNV